jgi:drug/metabolite transporter (DMT)-like permease
LAALLLADWSRLPDTPVEVGVLLWLGLGASGVGYFLWNRGALRVDPGTLAIMNNLLIPAGLIVNLSIWGRDTSLDELVRLTIGAGIILGALLLNRFFIARHGQSAPAA